MTSEEIIKVIEDNNYYAHTNEDIELCYAVSHLGYVEYNNHILNILDPETSDLFDRELMDEAVEHTYPGDLYYQRLFDCYVELHKDKYNEDFLINKETGFYMYIVSVHIIDSNTIYILFIDHHKKYKTSWHCPLVVLQLGYS